VTKRHFDLDAVRAARAEAQAEAPAVTFGGKEYQLPTEMPWAVVEAAASGDATGVVEAVKALLGDQWEDFASHGLSVADMIDLMEHIGALYGGEPGKSSE